MKRLSAITAWALLCVPLALGAGGTPKDPETVVVTFHVREGKQADMEKLLRQDHWTVLRRMDLVFETPHVLVRCAESGGKPCFVEVLTWKSHEIPDNAPPEVQAIWTRMNEFVEKRDGKPAIEIDEVEPIVPMPR